MGNAGGTITQSHERVPFCLNIEWREREQSTSRLCVIGCFRRASDFHLGRRKGEEEWGKKKKKKEERKGEGTFPLTRSHFRATRSCSETRRENERNKTKFSSGRHTTRISILRARTLHTVVLYDAYFFFLLAFFFSSFFFLEIFYGTVSFPPLFRCFFVERAFIWQLLRCKSNFNNDTLKLYASVAGFLLDLVNRFWFETCSYG